MIEFVWPWVFVLVIAPFIVRLLLKPKASGTTALRVPRVSDFRFTESLDGNISRWRNWGRWLLLFVAWALLVGALARPQWVGERVALPMEGRDMMLAVDISGSMSNYRMQFQGQRLTRLEAVKRVVTQFLERREGDRVGLIVFGTYPFVYAPLTFDIETVNTLLVEAPSEIAGGKTAIGDTIGLAVKRLKDRPVEARVVILLTDGSHNEGALSPLEAARLAEYHGVRIYTVGIGSNSRDDLFIGRFRINSQTRQNLDTGVMQEIADLTGGQFFVAHDAAELREVYEKIDELEPIEQEEEFFRPIKALFYWPLGLAAIVLLGLWLFRTR